MARIEATILLSVHKTAVSIHISSIKTMPQHAVDTVSTQSSNKKQVTKRIYAVLERMRVRACV